MMYRESKAELTDRLRREGRWEDFKKRREAIKASGVRAREAWVRAAGEFPPNGAGLAIQPTVPWRQARRQLNAARDDFDWLLMALDVVVPPKVAAKRPELTAVLCYLRSCPSLLKCFHGIAIRRISMRSDTDASRKPTGSEILEMMQQAQRKPVRRRGGG